MSSFVPREPYSTKELQKLYPSNLKLQQVQILFRHGERAPTSSRFEHIGVPALWPYCSASKHLLSAVDNICNVGELTDQGRKSCYALGARLRHLYVDQVRFLPSIMRDSNTIYLRATRIPRALDSLQEAFGGIYPPEFRSNSSFGRRSAEKHNTSPDMDYLNTLIGKWMPEKGKRVAIDSSPRLSGILDTVNSTLAQGNETHTKLPKEFYDPKGMEIMNKLVIEEWYSGYKESQEYRALGIGALLGDIVSRMVVSVERGGMEDVSDVKNSSRNSVDYDRQKPAIKLGLSGCHDTIIAAVLTSLQAFKLESWPQFTSHIALELFKKEDTSKMPSSTGAFDWLTALSSWYGKGSGLKSSNFMDSKGEVSATSIIARQKVEALLPAQRSKLDGYYVRIRYNDETVTIPGCKSPGKHLEKDESFCTLEAFKAIVDKFTPLKWKEECRSNLGAPAISERTEPTGY
ncbi:histidine acid phosphatase-like protein [Halenospora varia]|nr:histidine acid phosphatase-like protein [Halenospora varia]